MPACSVAVLCGTPKHARKRKRIGRESVWLSIPRVVRTATPPADMREYEKEGCKLSGMRQRKAKELSDFAPAALSRSVRVLVREPANERKNDNLEIESECPVAEIIEVVLDTFLN
jgi:hypothetical protein